MLANDNRRINHPADFDNLSTEDKETLCNWIRTYLKPAKQYYKGHTSYAIKHMFSSSPEGFYITNGTFKGAMLACGYTPKKDTLNWVFKIAAKSPGSPTCRHVDAWVR